MMTLQILKCVDFTKAQKSKNLENETLFFLQIKKFINYTSRVTLLQKNSFVAKVTLGKCKTNLYFKEVIIVNKEACSF